MEGTLSFISVADREEMCASAKPDFILGQVATAGSILSFK